MYIEGEKNKGGARSLRRCFRSEQPRFYKVGMSPPRPPVGGHPQSPKMQRMASRPAASFLWHIIMLILIIVTNIIIIMRIIFKNIMDWVRIKKTPTLHWFRRQAGTGTGLDWTGLDSIVSNSVNLIWGRHGAGLSFFLSFIHSFIRIWRDPWHATRTRGDHTKVETPIHDNVRQLVTWECKEHGAKSWMC